MFDGRYKQFVHLVTKFLVYVNIRFKPTTKIITWRHSPLSNLFIYLFIYFACQILSHYSSCRFITEVPTPYQFNFHNTYIKVTRLNTLKCDDCCTHIYSIIPQNVVMRFVFMSHILQTNTLFIHLITTIKVKQRAYITKYVYSNVITRSEAK